MKVVISKESPVNPGDTLEFRYNNRSRVGVVESVNFHPTGGSACFTLANIVPPPRNGGRYFTCFNFHNIEGELYRREK